MDSVFKALSDKNRRKVLELLKKRDMSVKELLKYFQISQASLSHHLDILKRANLVIDERKGQFVYYSLNLSVVEEAINFFINM
ncbi:autorepressor SdpR family transcription factor, partial [Patescibacteria group bacterium]|nr:autorepressor SdpR family transcription factor [Patescibacteria group bacterium]